MQSISGIFPPERLRCTDVWRISDTSVTQVGPGDPPAQQVAFDAGTQRYTVALDGLTQPEPLVATLAPGQSLRVALDARFFVKRAAVGAVMANDESVKLALEEIWFFDYDPPASGAAAGVNYVQLGGQYFRRADKQPAWGNASVLAVAMSSPDGFTVNVDFTPGGNFSVDLVLDLEVLRKTQ